jgi:hypothetical protein
MELAREQLDALQGLAGTEEENRESARRQEEANEFLSQLVSGIDGLADSYDKQLDAMKPSGGLLAGLGAVALLFMDPETLFAGVRAAIDGVFAIVDSIKMFLDGDFSEGFALLGDNIGAVAAIVGTVAVLFGGRIIRLVGSLVKGVRGIARAVMKVGRFIGALAGRFGGLVKIFGRLFLPFTIITGAIGAIQGAIDGFKEDGILGGLEGGISGLLTTIVGYPLDLLKSAVAWIAGKFGFENAEATLNEFSFSTLISDSIGAIFDMIKGAFDWIGTLFTDPVAALESLAMGLIGPDGILGVVTAPIDKAINWVMGLFNLGDPDRDFSLYDVLYTPIDKTITWLQGLFTDPVAAMQQAWNGLVGEGGLIDIIYSPIDKAIAWIQGLFGWGNPEEPFKLSTLVKDAFTSAKDWIVGLFTWGSEAGTGEDGSWSISTFISGSYTAAKEWFTGLFTWAAEASQENFILDLFNNTIEKVKTFFTDLFDFLPSFAEIKASLLSILPDFMKPESIEEARRGIEEQIANEQARIQRSESGENEYYGSEESGREDSIAEIEKLQAQLAELPQANKGGFMKAPESGGLAMLHGAEIVAPLDSPQGKVLMAINDLMNAKSVAGAGEYGGMGGPMIVQGGSNSSSNNTNNVSTSTYTIQQGITPDDFLKRDFINFSY